jgi:phospholipase C
LLERARDRHKWSKANFEKLPAYEKNLHTKAFAVNDKDPHYRELTTLRYKDGDTDREMKVPKGDVLHQFREDTMNGKLPAVSWVVGSANFSDHPGAPWYGAWYVSEVLDILTQKPEVWKKTIFILCYDENDGYFDHVPPFVPPHPNKPGAGLVSKGIDTSVEYVTLEQDLKRTKEKYARESPIGLGYRVPLVIASPWSRGGSVCSQVFDHTSILQFLEKFLGHKTGKKIEETNISAWRRIVCGNLTSVFKPYNGEKIVAPAPVEKEGFYEDIHKAQFKKDPSGYKPLIKEQISAINKNPLSLGLMPVQEKGTRASCALPYQLYADGLLSDDKKSFAIKFAAKNEVFGGRAAGSPFNVYAYINNDLNVRNYAVIAGDELEDKWQLDDFANNNYHLRVNGPNGFFREFKGGANDPGISMACEYARTTGNKNKLTGNIELKLNNKDSSHVYVVEIRDNYKNSSSKKVLDKIGSTKNKGSMIIDCSKTFGWYDLTVKINGQKEFERRYAGRVETGAFSRTDPAIGK